MPPIIVYGTDRCPFTRKALFEIRAQGKELLYYNLRERPERVEEFLRLSPDRKTPLIVEKGRVSIGYGGS